MPAETNEPGVRAASERAALHRLRGASDARGRRQREIVCREPKSIPAGQNPLEFFAVYVNWYVCNGAVLLPAFGDRRADQAARELVAELFPTRAVSSCASTRSRPAGAASTVAPSSSHSPERAEGKCPSWGRWRLRAPADIDCDPGGFCEFWVTAMTRRPVWRRRAVS